MERFSRIEKQESLDVLNYQIRSCEKCRLHTTRKHALVGEGDINANIMFIALSPGAKEDVQNKMFVGPSGKVFDRLLFATGLKRDNFFMTNMVKCILPKNRKPKADEIEACSQFLNEEIDIIQPKIIVPLGLYATKAVLSKYHKDDLLEETGFRTLNGRLLTVNQLKIFPLTHPSALLYNPSLEAETLKKYSKLKEFL